MSSSRIQDSVQSYDEAENLCHDQGARLLQIRSNEMLLGLYEMRRQHFQGGQSYFYYHRESIVALGMKYGTLDGETTMYYSDMQPVDPVFYRDEIEAFQTK